MTHKLPPLHSLRLFEAAGRRLSFKCAAEELHVTPSAVSHGIKTLENWLGVALFTRGRRGLLLTPSGATYLSQVQTALDQLVQATETMPIRRSSRKVSVSVAPSFGMRWLIPHLHRFNRQHPDIQVSLDTSRYHIKLPGDGMDLAIRMGQGDWQDVKSTNLVVEKLQPVCAPSLAGRIRTSTDLAGQTLLHVTGIADDWATWARLADVQSLDLTQGLRFDTIDMAMEAAARGMGIAIGRFPLIVGDLEAGRLLPVLGPERPCRTGYWLLAPREALVRAEVALFRDWICAELKQPISPSAIHRPA